jgi:Rrf2 family protein
VIWSQTTEYALRAVVQLAVAPGEPRTTADIAAATRVPSGYLSKVLQTLARAGIVRARRGLGGGFVLGRPAAQLTVLDVVEAVDPIRRIRECPLGIPAHGPRLCRLHRRVDDALATVERAFAATRLTELLETDGREALCRPRPVKVHRASPR